MDVKDKATEKAAEKAAAYINVKPRTAFQVKKYLLDKGYEADVADQVIEQLKEYHYIDDFQYAEMYFRYAFEKGRGVSRIKRELLEKGVSSEVIDLAYEESDETYDQEEMAMEIAMTMIKGIDVNELDYDAKRRLQAKIGRRLMSRGFESDIIYKVIGKVVK